jgi:hypothetical protein
MYSPEHHHPDRMDQTPHREITIPWSKVLSKRSCPLQEDSTQDAKHSKEENHWLHPTSTKNRFSALSSEEPTDTAQTSTAGDTPKSLQIFVSDVITIPPLLQLLDQIAFQIYEIKALAHNQVKIQPKTPDTYRAIIKTLADKNTFFHTFKPKEERSYTIPYTYTIP